jgi:hypothetical protein
VSFAVVWLCRKGCCLVFTLFYFLTTTVDLFNTVGDKYRLFLTVKVYEVMWLQSFDISFNQSRPKYRIVTVTIVTICDSVLWRLKVVTMRLVLESFKSLVLASSFWGFLRRPAFECNHLWLAKSGHKEDGYRNYYTSTRLLHIV